MDHVLELLSDFLRTRKRDRREARDGRSTGLGSMSQRHLGTISRKASHGELVVFTWFHADSLFKCSTRKPWRICAIVSECEAETGEIVLALVCHIFTSRGVDFRFPAL